MPEYCSGWATGISEGSAVWRWLHQQDLILKVCGQFLTFKCRDCRNIELCNHTIQAVPYTPYRHRSVPRLVLFPSARCRVNGHELVVLSVVASQAPVKWTASHRHIVCLFSVLSQKFFSLQNHPEGLLRIWIFSFLSYTYIQSYASGINHCKAFYKIAQLHNCTFVLHVSF